MGFLPPSRALYHWSAYGSLSEMRKNSSTPIASRRPKLIEKASGKQVMRERWTKYIGPTDPTAINEIYGIVSLLIDL